MNFKYSTLQKILNIEPKNIECRSEVVFVFTSTFNIGHSIFDIELSPG